MQNFDIEKQDQRVTCKMEDSNMTIEFLRARLLTERSVSKSARQRADELAIRVAELEEQLKVVSVQRRRAEKATADVLAILENNGVSDVSEELDSSSDQDTPFESNMDNVSTKEERSVSSKVRRKESGELSGSDVCSSVSGRSLSWKGRKSDSRSPEKYKDSLGRRRDSFAPMGFSSPKHRQGKSCRQIRRREARLAAEEHKSDAVKADPPVNGLVNFSEVNTNHSESEKDMEKALEQQAQLIDRYEAMERAQREWEEKFRENNSSTPDSCDPGNNSDVTEERYEIKVQAQYVSGTSSSQVQEAAREHIRFSAESPDAQSCDPVPILPSHGDIDRLQDRNCSSSLSPASLYPTSLDQKFIRPVAKENHHHENLQSNDSPLHSSRQVAHAHGSITEPSANKNEHYALVPHETHGKFTNVLDALQQARMSLQQKINTLPLIEGASRGKAIEPSVYGRNVGGRVEIPVGCSGLFRVPTDFSTEASKVNFPSSGSQLSLTNYYPGPVGVAPISSNHLLTASYMNTQSSSSSDRFFSSPYMDVRSSFSPLPTANASSGYINDDQILASRYAETKSRSANNPQFDPYSEPGLPASAPRSYPTFPSYPNLVPQIQAREGLVYGTTRSIEVRPDQFSFYNNQFRPDSHRL